MRVDGVVVVDPDGQLVDHGSDVGRFGEAGVVAFMVRTNASIMPLDCGLSMAIVRGRRLISRARRRVPLAV